MKICCFGSLNLDHVYQVDDFVHPGETISSLALTDVCGGKGLNQSIAMAKAGAEVYHAGNIGPDGAGTMLKKALLENGVRTEYVRTQDISTGHTIIQVSEAGENAIICYGGANMTVDEKQIEKVISSFASDDLIVLQNEVNMVSEIIRSAHCRGLKIALNPSPINKAISSFPLELCDILFVNEIEAKHLCENMQPSIEQLAALYPDQTIIYTKGKNGSQAYYNGNYYTQRAYSVRSVDSTGAGDTFTGYFLAGFCEGLSIQKAMDLAARAAAISVTRRGASISIPSRADVDSWKAE